MRTGRLAAALLVLAAISWPAEARAATEPDRLSWTAYTLAGTLVKPGAERAAIFGARADAVFAAPFGLAVFGRVDASALGDGGAAARGFEDIESFQTLEVYAGAGRPIVAGIGPAAVYGWTLALEGGRPQLLERNPRTVIVGGMARSEHAWAIVGAGIHEAAGDEYSTSPAPWSWRKVRLIAAAQVLVDGRTSLAGELVAGDHAFARGYVLVRVGGSR